MPYDQQEGQSIQPDARQTDRERRKKDQSAGSPHSPPARGYTTPGRQTDDSSIDSLHDLDSMETGATQEPPQQHPGIPEGPTKPRPGKQHI